ncbi:MAG: DUF3990 domain-containing protein [Bacilli bacterium]
MNKVFLYHGSCRIIEKPIFNFGKKYNDYGLGFYCTQNIEIAKEWACIDNQTIGFVNKYEIDLDKLTVLDLTNDKYTILNWLSILFKYRNFDLKNDFQIKAKKFLIYNFYIDIAKYDIVIGYRADDSYFQFVKDFINNTISIEKLSDAMRLGNLGKQVVLISQKAFNSVSFINYSIIDNEIYFTKRIARDKKARQDYQKNKRISSYLNEKYLIDIMREYIKNEPSK